MQYQYDRKLILVTISCSYRVGNDHKKGMSDLHEDFDSDQREG